MSAIDRLVGYIDDQVAHWRRASAWPIIGIIGFIVLSVFAGYVQARMGNMWIPIILLVVLLVVGFIFAYIARRPHIGLYLAVASFMLDSRGIPIPAPITLSLSNIFLIFTLMAVLLRWSHYRNRNVDKVSFLLGSGLLVAAFPSLFVAQFPGTVLRLMVTIIGGLIVLFLTQVLTTCSSDLARLVKVYIVGAVICALLGVIQALLVRFAGVHYGRVLWYLAGSGTGPIELSWPRVASTWLNPDSFGVFLVPAVPLVWGVFTRGWKRYLLVAILLSGMALSYVRSAWIATAVAVSVTIGVRWLSRKWDKRAGAPAMVIWLYLLLFIVVILIFAAVRMRIWDRLLSMNTEAFEKRIQMSLVGWRYFLASPLTGVGPGNEWLVLAIQTHNSYLDVLVEYGLVGGLAWFSLLVLTAWRGLKAAFRCVKLETWRLSVAYLGAFVGALTGGMAMGIQNNKFFWLMIAIITTLATQFSMAAQSESSKVEDAHA